PQAKPPTPPAAVQVKPVAPPAAQIKPVAPPPSQQPSPQKVEQPKPPQPPTAVHEERKDDRKGDGKGDGKRDGKRDTNRAPDTKNPAVTVQPAAPIAPAAPKAGQPVTTEKPADKPLAPAVQNKPLAPVAPGAPPAAKSAQPETKPGTPPAAVTVQPPAPTQPRNANEFIRKDGQPQQTRGMDDIRKERRETKDGNRTVIQEGDRTIVRDGNRSIIRHNEADRFSVGARDVKVERRGNDTISIIVRPNGISIVSTADRDGHVIRRVRRDRNGRDIVIFDSSFRGAQRPGYFVNVAPPRIGIPRDRYFVDGGRANRDQFYAVFTAPPVQRLERRYTVDEVRYSNSLRQYMPRVDIAANFESGSWQLSPEQVASLAGVAQALNRAIDKNPREVFMIEGHTDKVGSAEDNLSLSDRRAEAVAIALTEAYNVPPENLLTQGYGEAFPVVDTEAASRENRRVTILRATPLLAQAETQGGSNRR
ncbi:MAG: OmpA family protein, partial [Pseudolabrys sp.]